MSVSRHVCESPQGMNGYADFSIDSIRFRLVTLLPPSLHDASTLYSIVRVNPNPNPYPYPTNPNGSLLEGMACNRLNEYSKMGLFSRSAR